MEVMWFVEHVYVVFAPLPQLLRFFDPNVLAKEDESGPQSPA